MQLPIAPTNSDAARRRCQVHHQDFRASAARGRSRQGLERAKAHLREARLSLEKGDIVGARRVTDKALQIARSASSASQLQGTPLGADAENTVQEAISVAMYLSERLENTDVAHGRFALSAAIGRALSRSLDTNTKIS